MSKNTKEMSLEQTLRRCLEFINELDKSRAEFERVKREYNQKVELGLERRNGEIK